MERCPGLVGGEEIVQGSHVGRLVRLPEGSLTLGEGAEVGSAGGGGHAPVEAGARGTHAHAHTRCLEAHGGVEAIGHRDAHGAGVGRHGGALDWRRPRRVAQRQAAERRLVLEEETVGQILRLPKRTTREGVSSPSDITEQDLIRPDIAPWPLIEVYVSSHLENKKPLNFKH